MSPKTTPSAASVTAARPSDRFACASTGAAYESAALARNGPDSLLSSRVRETGTPSPRQRGANPMRAAVFNKPHSGSIADRRDAAIAEPTDAVAHVALACVCGSDLWFYRGETPFEPGPIGHEFVGVVEDVGPEVREIKSLVRVGSA